jgi:hypothetical protein
MTVSSTAIVPTENASRYLQQLCKHWSHKFETDFDENKGRIGFPSGDIDLVVVEGGLSVTVQSQLDDGLTRAKQVVAEHLDRFAFREAPLTFPWVDA